MSIGRKFLSSYRRLLNIVFGRIDNGILSPGEKCDVESYKLESYHGDIVHPCVRYSSDGCLGHKWWMVFTPYYKSNPATENPLLYYGNSESEKCPDKWHFYKEIKPRPAKGYNSDPNLVLDKDGLIIYWRENQTNRCGEFGYSRATFGMKITENGTYEFDSPILFAEKEHIDCEVSPAFILKNRVTAYATKVKFFNPIIRKLPRIPRKLIGKILLAIDLLGIYPVHKSYGISVWQGDSIDKPLKLIATNKIQKTNHLYQPWHLDVFEHHNYVFAVVQTNQSNADICLAKSEDGIHFNFYKHPLITNNSINKIGIYKPCGIVVNNTFHLFYTAQNKENRDCNILYHTSYDFEKLLSELE